MRPTKTRTRPPSLLALAALLFAGGCGGGGADDAAPPPPRPTIDRPVAERLADTSDAIADALDAGDVCTAAGLADDLNDQVVEAINAGEIPAAFQEGLQGRANELVNAVNCPPPPAPEQEEDEPEDEDEKAKEEKKNKKNEKGNDDGLELPVLPPEDE